MTAENTLIAVKQFCLSSSGDDQIWTNKGTTYYWNRGKDTSTGLINGVVRKESGVDSNGSKIWSVAGSLKIDPTGKILRFTGLPKKVQEVIQSVTVDNTVTEAV